MIQLLWSLLNIGLFIFFVVTCFRAAKLVREKFGMLAAVIFGLGLLSFVGKSSNTEKGQHGLLPVKTFEFTTDSALIKGNTHFVGTELERSLVTAYELSITYGKNSQEQMIPISAYSSMTGLISGTNWKATGIYVNRTNQNNRFEYFVYGVVEWQLLGLEVYSQAKEYRGFISTR